MIINKAKNIERVLKRGVGHYVIRKNVVRITIPLPRPTIDEGLNGTNDEYMLRRKEVIAHMVSCRDNSQSVAELAQELRASPFASLYPEYSSIQQDLAGFFIEGFTGFLTEGSTM